MSSPWQKSRDLEAAPSCEKQRDGRRHLDGPQRPPAAPVPLPPVRSGENASPSQFQFGRAVVLQHPEAADLERLAVAGKLLLAENIVDSCYCEEDEGRGGARRGLGGRLIMAQSALDPFHATAEMEEEWRHGVQADRPLRSYHWALKDYAALATPSQTDRFVHDIARLHLGYVAEAAWAETRHVPQVWEYLVMRQFNNFRPCLSILDVVDGYKLPEAFYARPDIQQITVLACNATTIVNDLYSFTRELGKIDDLYHHHYGIGDADWSVLEEQDPDRRRDRVTEELHRLLQRLLRARLPRGVPHQRPLTSAISTRVRITSAPWQATDSCPYTSRT